VNNVDLDSRAREVTAFIRMDMRLNVMPMVGVVMPKRIQTMRDWMDWKMIVMKYRIVKMAALSRIMRTTWKRLRRE